MHANFDYNSAMNQIFIGKNIEPLQDLRTQSLFLYTHLNHSQEYLLVFVYFHFIHEKMFKLPFYRLFPTVITVKIDLIYFFFQSKHSLLISFVIIHTHLAAFSYFSVLLELLISIYWHIDQSYRRYGLLIRLHKYCLSKGKQLY